MSLTGLPEFVDDSVTDYSRPSPTIESTSGDDQNKNPSVTKIGASDSTILSKPAIKFVKAVDKAAERPTTDKVETAKKPAVRYAELYRNPSKKSTVKGNQRNWNNLKSAINRPYRPLMRPMRPNMNAARLNKTSFYKPAHSYTKRPFQETTQDLMIILIQKVKKIERELKARTPVHKVDKGRSRPVMAWVPKKV
nr:hypothetical protein [Tanacetum cinerariifolium]